MSRPPLIAAALLLLPALASAQLPAPRTYLYIRGTETLGAERLVVTDTSIEGTLHVMDTPRIVWQHVRRGDMFGTLRMYLWAPGSDPKRAPAQSAVFMVRGDTAHVDFNVTAGTTPRHQTIQTRRAATALINNSVLHAAIVGLRTLRAGKQAADVFYTTGGKTVVLNVARRNDGVVLTIDGVEMLVTVGDDGLPISVSIPRQGLRLVLTTAAVPAKAPTSPDPRS